MPTLNWIGKEKIVNHDKEVPFRLLKKNKKLSLGTSENLIVEGDNLEALKALMPYYHGRIKCIYIDPPYNTGNEKWVYNDRVNSPKIKEWLGKTVGPEGEDLTRHDKWLCMMYPRLKLLRDLLDEDGVIFVSIDDNEIGNLRLILDEIYEHDNFICTFIWEKKHTRANDAKYISDNHDFILCYARKLEKLRIHRLVRSEEANSRFRNPDNDPRGPWISQPLQVKTPSEAYIYEIKTPCGLKIKPPTGRSWAFGIERYRELVKENRIYFGEDGKNVPRLKKFLSEVKNLIPLTIWPRDEVGDNQEAKTEVKNILRDKQLSFDNPKPTRLIKRIIEIATDKNSIVLDSFAGSGTTSHAVLDLNKEDGGNRKFILVEMEKDICRDITAERIRRVAKGYSYKKNGGDMVKVAALGGGFEYVELGDTLFNNDGTINQTVSFKDMASYIYFTETHTNLDKNKIKENYLGEFASTHYFLLFDGIGKNILDRSFLKELKTKEGRKIVYADKCLLGEEILEKHQIIFRQIPYQVKVY